METLNFIKNILEYLIFIYLSCSAIYIFIFALAGILVKKNTKKLDENNIFRKFAVLIPGYKEDNVILEVAENAILQNYPTSLYDVVIIADSFQQNTLEKLRKLPLILIEVSFDKSTKSKALIKAMEVLGNDYDVALILDADNLMEKDFITKMNVALNLGYEVVQGHRVAKNMNTSLAVLDAISEEINNHIFRKGHRALGFSSALIGSGMAFNYNMFKERMSEIKAVGGFDKELELTLLRDKFKIEYLNDALVYDEKVQKADVFGNQRKRWLSAQFIYFGRFFLAGLKHLFLHGNIDFFDKVFQMISPPRVLLLGFTGLIAFSVFFIELIFPHSGFFSIHFEYWFVMLGVVILAFIFSIPIKFYNRNTFLAIKSLPKVFGLMLLSLLKLKGANQKFIHTKHGS